MQCAEVQDLLSAYHDGELPEASQAIVSEHLAACTQCAKELEQFQGLSEIAGTLLDPEAPNQIWDSLARQLPDPKAAPTPAPAPRRMRAAWAVAAIAASLLVVGWLVATTVQHDHDEREFVSLFGQYLETFPNSPAGAQQLLVDRFASAKTGLGEAATAIGYQPAVAVGLPDSYTVKEVRVFKMPCCTCVQCLCETQDGKTVAIFEHDETEAKWFGTLAEKEVVCGETECKVVDLAEGLAATWRRGPRMLTVVGAPNLAELEQLVAWFERPNLQIRNEQR